MKKTLTTLTLILALTVCVFGQKSEEELIRKTYEDYNTFLLNSNGDKAVKLIDSKTLKYYSEILDLVINADSVKVEGLPILDKLTILIMRHLISKEDLLSFDGESLFIYAINKGIVNKKSNNGNTSLGDITIDNYIAKATIMHKGQNSPFFIHFHKEGQWKFDLTSTFAIANKHLQKMEDKLGKKLLINMIGGSTRSEPNQNIWQPVR